MEASDDDNEYNEDYKDEVMSHDNYLGRLGCFVKSALSKKELSKGLRWI